MKHIKCVMVGDGGCGRTKFIIAYTTNAYPNDYIPIVFDNYSANIMVEDQAINLQIWDTAGQEDYKKLRPLSYEQTDIFIITFSLVSPTSLENVENFWVPEIKEHCPGIPFILVGLKSGLRDDFYNHESEYKAKGWSPVSYEDGLASKEKIGALDYVECDAKMQYNVAKPFESAIKIVLHYHYETENEKKERLMQEKKQLKIQQKEEQKRQKQMKKEEKMKRKQMIKNEKQKQKQEKKERNQLKNSSSTKKLHFDIGCTLKFKISYD